MTKLAALLFAAMAVIYAAMAPAPSPRPMPSDARALAARVASLPSDWAAAAALTDKALDTPARDRLALWRAANALASSAAPSRPEPRVAFARSGFFHWAELSEADRKAVLAAYAPQLRDPVAFPRSFHEVYALTGDLDYLRASRPAGAEASRLVAWLASTYGHFDDYRSIRAEMESRSELEAHTPPSDIMSSAWTGLCGEDVCSSAWRVIEASRSIAIAVQAIKTDDVAPYVEIYVDGVRSAEGELAPERTLTADVGSGRHEVEVRLVNNPTRNSEQRRVRITSVRAI